MKKFNQAYRYVLKTEYPKNKIEMKRETSFFILLLIFLVGVLCFAYGYFPISITSNHRSSEKDVPSFIGDIL